MNGAEGRPAVGPFSVDILALIPKVHLPGKPLVWMAAVLSGYFITGPEKETKVLCDIGRWLCEQRAGKELSTR